jgi:hypothetical protein
MRSIPVLVCVFAALISSSTLAQQPGSGTTGETIGSPPPLPGPPPLTEPSAMPKPADTPAKSDAPAKGDAANTKGYLGAYAPAGSANTPYSTGPLPSQSAGPGLNVIAPDGASTKTVRAVPCSTSARETDGFTTCVGVPDQSPSRRRR